MEPSGGMALEDACHYGQPCLMLSSLLLPHLPPMMGSLSGTASRNKLALLYVAFDCGVFYHSNG